MKHDSTSTLYYLYDREDRIADYDTNGNLMIAYTHGPGMDEPVALNLNNSTYFYIPGYSGKRSCGLSSLYWEYSNILV